MYDFWDITAGNVVTWGILVAGFATSQYVSIKLLGQRIDSIETWKKEQQATSNERDQIIRRMDKTLVELATLSKVAHRRLEMLDRRKSFSEGDRG